MFTSSIQKQPNQDPANPMTRARCQQLQRQNSDRVSLRMWYTEMITGKQNLALKTVVGNYSYKSCEKIDDLFQKMFPDSKIAKIFTCGEKKCAYVICFGLAPYFRDELLDKFCDLDYVLLFDESLNHKTQNKQLDIYVRFCDKDTRKVTTRYFDSAFIGHATANYMIVHFTELTKKLKLGNMIQLSMDGPNINWSFYDKLSAELKSVNTAPSLINIGSCGLHVIHGGFKSACDSVDWDIAGLLRAMHTLFKDTPASREDYEEINGCKLYPLKHCATRWVEDVPVANRAMEVLPLMKKYVETVQQHPNKYTVLKTQSFKRVKDASENPLTLVKLQFFVSLAEESLPFLVKFQTDNPVLPFLSKELEKLMRNLMMRCVKSGILNKADIPSLLLKVDITKSEVLKSYKHVNVGFSATHKLKELIATKTISERQELKFQMECRDMLVKEIGKLLEKSPLKYSLTRNVMYLAPGHMVADPEDCRARFSCVLSTLVHCKRIKEHTCDGLLKEYDTFFQEVVRPNKHKFKDFDMKSCRLDNFLGEYMDKNNAYTALWAVIRMLLVLLHGQASVERGFSINKVLMVDNMSEISISAQSCV
ncbi:uncharacterized protein LOC121388878 [Gigantopelta aegis]|uniref:uncharacterized protein LOC121388878 n=1 Tax=Gigantopelta aegis TaxID=1735272 RepID=UPI001B8880EE|nr:uncharacterized protein LOC121388878 [Gigantopelta aegis]